MFKWAVFMVVLILLLGSVLVFGNFVMAEERVISIVDAVTGLNMITIPPVHSFTVNVTLNGLTENLGCFQVAVCYEYSKVKCVGAWLPKNDPNFVFYGKQIVQGGPTIYNEQSWYAPQGYGYVVIGASLLYWNEAVTTSQAILCQINFTAIKTGTTTLNIIPTDSPEYGDDTFLMSLYKDWFIFIPFTSEHFSLTIESAISGWTGTVYIRADGSIYPSDAPVITYDNVTYILTDNITSYEDGIVVERDNIIINGVGYTIQGTGSGKGIDLSDRTNVTVKNMQIKNFDYGIYLSSSSNNVISDNNMTNNRRGVNLYNYSSNNSISGNNMAYNYEAGVSLDSSSNNSISRNNIKNNVGTGVSLWTSYYNNISGNDIKNNDNGVFLCESFNNTFYHNNFIDNARQVYDPSRDVLWFYSPSINIWDDGYPYSGNYWNDYTGVDLFSGPYQNITGSDGIGDIPYVIDKNNVDHYPLMGPFKCFNTSVGFPINVISNSKVEDFKYFESNSTIVLQVSNMTSSQTTGFCRLTIPHNVIAPPYTVKVNGTLIDYQTIYENQTEGISIIYFTYKHSTLEIVIVPEFPSTTILLSTIILAMIVVLLVKRKIPNRNHINKSYSL